MKFNVAQKVTKILEAAGIPYEIYDNVKPNPTTENVLTGVKAYAASGADFLLAIGGGSSMDTAKAIGIITNNPEFSDVVSLEGVAATKNKSVPIIAVIDPEMMASMPKGLTAATGMDALTHAIEGYITKGAWVLTDTFELKAIELIAKNLEKAVFEPNNMEARENMGVENVDNMSTDEFRKAAVDAVVALSKKIGIPQKLSEIGSKEGDLEKLSKIAFNDVCTLGNPRDNSVEEILAIYKKAFK